MRCIIFSIAIFLITADLFGQAGVLPEQGKTKQSAEFSIDSPDAGVSYHNDIFVDSLENEKSKFIYTYSGILITGSNFKILNEVNGMKFRIDTLDVMPSDVKFFQFKNSFWANTKDVHFENKIDFARRTHAGRINLFEREVLGNNLRFEEVYVGPDYLLTRVSKDFKEDVFTYYNKGFGDLKILKYKNLIVDLYNNPNSMRYLNRYENLRVGCSVLYLAGIASILYGFTHEIKQRNSNSPDFDFNRVPTYCSIGIGLGAIWFGSSLSGKKSGLLLKAIEVY
jgi:hypothetical protein